MKLQMSAWTRSSHWTSYKLHSLRQLKAKKSPGPDAITNEILTHLGNKATCKLLEIFNHYWATGTLPQTWREATVIPILKKGTDPKQAASYRTISLTNCVGKTMERVVNQRLKWYLETNDILAPEQAGFRQFRATEDQTTYLVQEIEDAFQEKKATRIDLQRAFDKVWIDGLIVMLMRNGVANTMLNWIQSYLFNRRTRVSLDQLSSRKILLRQGVPQGGVLSPTLFLVSELHRGVKAALYADDLVLWCKEEHASTANYRIQPARTRQHMQSSYPMDPSTLRNPWQRASRSASQMRSTRRATISQHPLPGKDHHHQNSVETQTGKGCIPPSWQARPGGFGTTAFRPQQAQRTHAQETKDRSFPNVSLWWVGPDNQACSSKR